MNLSAQNILPSAVPLTMESLVNPSTTALVLWDMQRGLAGKANNIDAIRPVAQRLIEAADRAGVLVIWSRHILPPLDLMIAPMQLFMMRKQKVDHPSKLKPFMNRGAPETEFIDGFEPASHHVVLEKGVPSLFVDTPLDSRLKARGIRSLVLAGVATEIGIEFTARHASALGYFSVAVEDATGSYTTEPHLRSLEFLRTWANVATSDEICSIWDAGAPTASGATQ